MSGQAVAGRTNRASIVLEAGWIEESPRDEIELLAILPGPEGSFAPNLVVTVNPFEGGIDEFLGRAVQGISSTLHHPYIFDIRAWDKAGSIDDADAPASGADIDVSAFGRSIHYTHVSPNTGSTLRVTEWLFISHRLAVQVTGSATTAQWQVLGPTLERLAKTITTPVEA